MSEHTDIKQCVRDEDRDWLARAQVRFYELIGLIQQEIFVANVYESLGYDDTAFAAAEQALGKKGMT